MFLDLPEQFVDSGIAEDAVTLRRVVAMAEIELLKKANGIHRPERLRQCRNPLLPYLVERLGLNGLSINDYSVTLHNSPSVNHATGLHTRTFATPNRCALLMKSSSVVNRTLTPAASAHARCAAS